MNTYLLEIASYITEMRKALDLTQEDLASLMGVSRPTLVKIEQDPSKLTKTLAFALFCALMIEVKRRMKEVDSISAGEYASSNKVFSFLGKVQAASAISTTGLGKIGAVSTLIPGIGSAITAAIRGNLPTSKEAAIQQLKEAATWDEEKASKFLQSVKDKLVTAEQDILRYLQLEDWSVEEFGDHINKE